MTPQDPKDRLIFALDVPNKNEALHYAELLKGQVGCFKIGLELFISEGPEIVREVKRVSGADIFLDLKLHDIPATLNRSLKSASKHSVKFITIHFEEGEAAHLVPKEVINSGLNVLAVTVLTSISFEDLVRFSYRKYGWQSLNLMVEALFKNAPKEILRLSKVFTRKNPAFLMSIVLDRAKVAKASGCSGVICSGLEVSLIKKIFGQDFIAVVPGIRPKWSLIGNDDQSRIVTPTDAVKNGADYIVVGRPIRDAKLHPTNPIEPQQAAQNIVQEIKEAMESQ